MREDTPGSTLRNARELRRRMTNAEEILWRVLRDRRSLGLKFRRQVPIGGITGGHAGAATGGEEQRCAEARRQSTWRLTAEEARADAVGRVEDTRFEEGETADLQGRYPCPECRRSPHRKRRRCGRSSPAQPSGWEDPPLARQPRSKDPLPTREEGSLRPS
jgi:hypothetical protein